MAGLRTAFSKVARLPGVSTVRSVGEQAFTPHVRVDVQRLALDHASTEHRLQVVEAKVDDLLNGLAGLNNWVRTIEEYQPAVLNAIASTNGVARTLSREMAAVSRHVETIAWLLQRVETVRAEMMHEFRYGAASRRDGDNAPPVVRIINPSALEGDAVKLNLGAGHIALAGYANVDVRELPGIDVVAAIDELPVPVASVHEIFSSHTLEHFPELELRRRLLPYWRSLLTPGGTFRAVVPDLEAMAKAYAAGDMSFERLRMVTYGGQEYEGDFHFTGFTPESLVALVLESGFVEPTIIARGRPNGDCLEFEIAATRPAD